MIATIADNWLVSASSCLAGAGFFLQQLRKALPLMSDRANDRAVRLIKAKKKSK